MIKAQKVKLARKDIEDGFPEKDVLKKYDLKARDLIKKDTKKIAGFKVETKKASGEQPSVASGEQPSVASGEQPSVASGEQPGVASGEQPGVASGEPSIDLKLSDLLKDETEKVLPVDELQDLVDDSGIELLLQDREMVGQLLEFYVTDILKSDKALTSSQKKIVQILVPRIAEKRLKNKKFKYMDEIVLLIVMSSITLPRIDWKKINSLKGKNL